jgi:hypothetical protein
MSRRCGAASLVVAALIASGCGSGGAGTKERINGSTMAKTIPAQIDARPHGFTSTDQVRPVVNAWRVSSAQNLTEVDAGATAGDRSVGAFVIFRHDFSNADQDVNLVKVIGSGPLRITGAPRGPGAEESGQQKGVIDFVGQAGVSGALHLSDDTVTLDPPR